MTVDDIVTLGTNAMMVTLLVSAPMLLSGMAIGLTISILQSVTQIQEITLTFVPKIIVVMFAFVVFFPWMIDIILGFARPLFANLHVMIR